MKPPSLAVRRRCRLFCSSKIGESREQKIATETKAKTRRNGDPIEKLLGRQQSMSSGGRRTQFLASRVTAPPNMVNQRQEIQKNRKRASLRSGPARLEYRHAGRQGLERVTDNCLHLSAEGWIIKHEYNIHAVRWAVMELATSFLPKNPIQSVTLMLITQQYIWQKH
jgi:hypothetical protein